jgi:hypothetical protein
MTPLCKDCNWYKKCDYYGTDTGDLDKCLCPEIKTKFNLVTGIHPKVFCSIERRSSGQCGIDGKYWMEKPPEENFWSQLFNFK